MTDTGQVPGEGQPESAGMVEQPGVPAHGAYTYLSEAPAEDEDLLLPGAQGAWGNEVPPPAPEPVVEAVHEPGPHETAGRDTGSVDLGGVRLPDSGPASVPPSPILSAPHDPVAAPQPPRRPLHLGPPIPDASASPVRSLADRGPAGAPVRQPAPPSSGPEYLDAQPQPAPQNAVPWGAAPGTPPPAEGRGQADAVPGQEDAQAQAQAGGPVPAPGEAQVQAPAEAHVETQDQAAVAAEVPVQREAQAPVQADVQVPAPVGAQVPAAETVGPAVPAPAEPADAAQAAMARLASQATAHSASGEVHTAPAEAPGIEGTAPDVAPEDAEAVAEAVETAEPGAPAQAVGIAQAAEAAAATVEAAAAAVGTAEAAATAEASGVASAPETAAATAEATDPAVAEAVQPSADAEQAEDAQPAAQLTPQATDPTQPQPAAHAPEPAAPTDPAAAEAPVAVQEAAQPVDPAAVQQVAQDVAPAADPAPAAVQEVAQAPVPVSAEAPAAVQEVAQPVDAAAIQQVAQEVAPAAVPASAEAPAVVQEVAQAVAPVAGQDVAQAPVPASAEAPVAVQEVAQPVDAAAIQQVAQEVAQAAVPAPAEAPAAVQEVAQAAAPDMAQAPDPAPAEAPVAAQEMAQPVAPAAIQQVAQDAAPAVDPAPAETPAAGQDVPQATAPEAPADPAAPVADPAPAQPAPAASDAVPAAQPAVPQAPEAPQPQAPGEAPEPAVLQTQGPQLAEQAPHSTEAAPEADAPVTPAAPTPEQQPQAAPAAAPESHPDPQASAPDTAVPDTTQPLGQFVPVQGQVPTTPHLAPVPQQPAAAPAAGPQGPQEQPEPVATVPAPREGEPAGADAQPAPEAVRHAEDPETGAAEQEESTAEVARARRSAGPAAPAYADAEREAVLKVMRERRDIRNGFRDDPIPHEVLLRVLEAAHTAPSVGHSQPWDFVVIRSAETRRTMHELAMRQREAYAKSLPKGRAKQFKELKIEAILDTPVNIVVTADPTRGGRHTLGRHTQPQMAPYSSALAVENLWLAARAEGLGVGWVSFFDEREMVRALGLPEHLEVVAYLCVGYVDEFPDEPELMQAGWSKRRPLSWVVHEETYGRRALPGEEPHDLLAETVAQIRPLDAKALGEAWERQKRMTKPAGALGMLEIISAQLCGLSRQCPPPIPEPAAVAIFAGDHGVHAQGVTPWPQEVTAQMVANFLGGGAVCNAFAAQVGAEVCVVDVGVAADLPATPGLLPRKIRGGTSDMTTGPAMTREEVKAAIEVGIETARDLVAAGNKALLTGEMGIANTTASAALISVFTGADPAEVTGRGTGINDETLARKTDVVRRALEFHQPDPADPIGVLAAVGGFEHAAMVGLLLGGASLRTPVILDGVSAGAAALVARAIAPEVLAACIAGHRSAEPGHVAALNKLGLRPLVDLDLRLGEGTGALLALPLVQSTARAMHEVATFDSAGVTEK